MGGVIDLRDRLGNIDLGPWGQVDTTLYAQLIIPDDTMLEEVRMRCTPSIFAPAVFNIMVTGARHDAGGLGWAPSFADTRYNSGRQYVRAEAGLTEVGVAPNLAVTPGEPLFLVFDSFSYPTEAGVTTMRATAYNSKIDHYPAGEFVYLNTSILAADTLAELDAFPWEHRAENNQDLALYVSFTPEPTGALMAILGAGMLSLSGRRRRMRGSDRSDGFGWGSLKAQTGSVMPSKRARPRRIMVAPSSTATSKSFVMPMHNSVNSGPTIRS
jgi:hypothetical protein